MSRIIEKQVEKAINIPANIQQHINAATYDLYYGPQSVDLWREETGDENAPDYSFGESLDIIRNWFDDDCPDLYVNEFHEVETEEDPASTSTEHCSPIERDWVKFILLGKLASYL